MVLLGRAGLVPRQSERIAREDGALVVGLFAGEQREGFATC